jgi:glycosyltransferase involved in cell wall biosynthesis
MWGIRRTGGTVTFTEIGKRLIQKGHRVTITALDDGYGVMTDKGFKPRWEPDIPIEYIPVNLGNRYWRMFRDVASRMLNPRALAFDWENIHRIIDYIPECDINIATYFPSTFSVYLSNKGKAQFYHMQHYEPLFFDAGVPFVPSPGPVRALLSRLVNRVAPQSLLLTSLSRLAELSYVVPLNRIANSSWLQKTVKEKHGAESTVINHAIRNEVFYPRPQTEKSRPKRILCLGKTDVFWKGVGTLADALKIVSKKHDDIELVLYGSESHPQVDFPYKYVLSPSFEELAELYCSSSIVVCPSWYESFPAPPLEGMACGVPVVTTAIGTEDYARDGENCLVVPPRNPEAMADAILRLLSDKDLCHKLSEEGPKTARQFTWDKTADKIEKLFEQTLKKGG